MKHDIVQRIKDRVQAGKRATDLFTVNSLSGGRTSSLMAVLNPADMDIFALVQTDDPRYHVKDKAVQRFMWDKLGTDLVYSTLESDDTLKTMMELEQFIGREVTWIVGNSMDRIIDDRKNFLPNPRARYCTTEMKLKPIFEHFFYNRTPSKFNGFKYDANHNITDESKLRMNIGYRIDDFERVGNFTDTFKYSNSKHPNGRNKWTDYNWRIGNFPVLNYSQSEIISFWKNKPVTFPKYNNCEFCMNKPIPVLQEMFETSDKGDYWLELEKKTGNRFRFDYPLQQIKNMPRTMDIDFTSVTMCGSGGCTD